MRIQVYPNWKMNFNSKNGTKGCLSCWTKASIHISQRGEWVYGTQSWREMRILCESMFVLIDIQTLIIKMMEREAFFMKPEH